MLKLACVLLAVAGVAFSGGLDTKIKPLLSGFRGTVYLYAQNLDTRASYGVRENERVRTASTIKLPIMCGVFNAIENGHAKWQDQITLHDEDKVSGSGVLREFSNGDRFTVEDLVHMMIVVSDNTATNLILDHFSGDDINAFADRLGLKNTRVLRKVRGDGNQLKSPSGWTAAGRVEENQRFGLGFSTPRDMVLLLEQIANGKVVNAAASKEMIEILGRQQDSTGMRRRIHGMRIANKTGSLDHLRSDVGLVFTPHGRVAMAITCEDIPEIDYTPDNTGSILIADIAKVLVESLQ